MTSNIHQLDKTVLEYLELQQHEAMLKDQIKSIKNRMNTIQPIVCEVVKHHSENTIPVLPTPDQMNRFGEMGALRLREVNASEKLSRKYVAEQITKFFEHIVPGQNTLAQLFSEQLSEWLWTNRSKSKTFKLQRVYAAEMEAKKAKKRKPVDELAAPPAKKSTRPKTVPNVESSDASNKLRTNLFQQIPTILTSFEKLAAESDQKK